MMRKNVTNVNGPLKLNHNVGVDGQLFAQHEIHFLGRRTTNRCT